LFSTQGAAIGLNKTDLLGRNQGFVNLSGQRRYYVGRMSLLNPPYALENLFQAETTVKQVISLT
jgi:hypothetical protein